MSRIIIFGNSGSGKSTLAQAIAAKAGCSHLDLDTIAWQSSGVRAPLDHSIKQLNAFCSENTE